MSDIDCLVIGAGVVGLAAARELALTGREVVIAEAAEGIGTQTSARNSEVIHAGIYYPPGSLKARVCVVGRKKLYLLGILIFVVASALCGIARSLPELIAFRILQGIGGASLGANSIEILNRAAGKALRARAMGYFSAAQAVGVSLGPIAGGLLLGFFGWQAIFWVTVPIGLIGVALGWIILPDDTDRDPRPFDWWGMILLGPALVA